MNDATCPLVPGWQGQSRPSPASCFGACPETAPGTVGRVDDNGNFGSTFVCAPTALAVGRCLGFVVGLPCGFFRKDVGTPARARGNAGVAQSPGGCRKRPAKGDEHTIHGALPVGRCDSVSEDASSVLPTGGATLPDSGGFRTSAVRWLVAESWQGPGVPTAGWCLVRFSV